MKLGRIIALHPAIISGLYLADGFATVMSTNVAATAIRTNEPNWHWIWLEATLTFATMFIIGAWVYDTARVSASRLLGEGSMRSVAWAVAIFLIGGFVATLLIFPYRLGAYAEIERSLAVTAAGLVFVASYFIAAWLAAAMLVKAELKMGKHSSTFVTFLLLLYLVIGVWALRPRVLRLQQNSSGDTH